MLSRYIIILSLLLSLNPLPAWCKWVEIEPGLYFDDERIDDSVMGTEYWVKTTGGRKFYNKKPQPIKPGYPSKKGYKKK